MLYVAKDSPQGSGDHCAPPSIPLSTPLLNWRGEGVEVAKLSIQSSLDRSKAQRRSQQAFKLAAGVGTLTIQASPATAVVNSYESPGLWVQARPESSFPSIVPQVSVRSQPPDLHILAGMPSHMV